MSSSIKERWTEKSLSLEQEMLSSLAPTQLEATNTNTGKEEEELPKAPNLMPKWLVLRDRLSVMELNSRKEGALKCFKWSKRRKI